ncbi:MAG: hypothetical protein K8S27_09065 [Candidatus Omnitrophica bacterium]|nr:hypothetical protein [Candidatus Omnitrophota bacterium]
MKTLKDKILEKRKLKAKSDAKKEDQKVSDTHIAEMMDHRLFLKIIGIPIALLFLIKFYITSDIFKTPLYRGEGFSISCPDGWDKMDKKEKYNIPTGVFLNENDYDTVTCFLPSEQVKEGTRPTYLSAFATQTYAPYWIEDIFPQVMDVLIKTPGYVILDKGELKVDEQVSRWVLYDVKKEETVYLEFFMVDERNGFFKLRYQADYDKFKKFRPAFETFRDSFAFSKGLL